MYGERSFSRRHLHIPTLRVFLELPAENVVIEASFVDAMNELPDLVTDWEQRREAELQVLVARQPTGWVDPLKLVTTASLQ